MSPLIGELEGEIEIKSSAQKFHNIISCRLHEIFKISPRKIKQCAVLEGEVGKAGTTVVLYYYHDGKTKVAKELIEDINNETNSVTYKVIEGDMLDEFKDMKFVIKATPMAGGRSAVHWTMEYEKVNESIQEPKSLLEFFLDLSKDIDEHLQVGGTRELEVMVSLEIDVVGEDVDVGVDVDP